MHHMPIALLNAVHFKTTGSSEMSKKAIKPDSKIEKSKKQYLVVGIGFNLIKSPNILNYPTTNLLKITKQKINKKKFVKELKITFEKFLSKYYKTN